MTKLATLDLFSGIGGLTHALRDVAHPVGYCEIAPVPRAMLEGLMRSGDLPEAPVHEDVAKLDGSVLCGDGSVLYGDGEGKALRVKKVDMIVGGFPCTAVSCAGLAEGLSHPATGLFWQIVRLARETSPDFLFLENVAAITERRQAGGTVLEPVVAAVHAAGYECRWITLPAYQVGGRLQRFRWFCLCYKPDAVGAVLNFEHRDPFDWAVEPPGPRMVVPADEAAKAVIRRRIAALGNSVVPDCAAVAFRALWTGLSVPLGELLDMHGPVPLAAIPEAPPVQVKRARAPRYGHNGPGGEVVPLPPPPGVVPPPPKSIRLSQDVCPVDDTDQGGNTGNTDQGGNTGNTDQHTGRRRVIDIVAWPGPRYSNGWHGARLLTYRGRGDLGTAVRFAVESDPSRYPCREGRCREGRCREGRCREGRCREGYTSPEFVEWLMGYPPGWTARLG